MFQGDLRFTMYLKITFSFWSSGSTSHVLGSRRLCVAKDQTQDFVHAMQTLYELSYILATSEVKGQLCGVSSPLPPHSSGGLNSGCQAW